MTIQGLYHVITTSHGDKKCYWKICKHTYNLNFFLHINFNIVLSNFIMKLITHALIFSVI